MPTTWVRVRDTSTGHQFDVHERSIRHGMERLNDPRYPDLTGPLARPRQAKVFVGKDGLPAVPGAVVVVVEADDTEGPAALPPETSPARPVETTPHKSVKASAAEPTTPKESDQ